MTSFARNEASRFANQRLERNREALEKMQDCRGLPGLIGVQQEWLRGFVEDYLAQQMRLAGALRGIAHNVVASAAETASENIDRMQQDGQQVAQTAGQQMEPDGGYRWSADGPDGAGREHLYAAGHPALKLACHRRIFR